MLPLKSPPQVARELAQRLRTRRLQRGWTQTELARRAGLSPATYILFERTGNISLLRLLKILELLDLIDEFDALGRGEDLAGVTLAQLTRPVRKRGRYKRS